MNAPASPTPNSEDRNLAGRQLGRYEVLTQLASGGMAAVYIARAQGVAGFERLVAIKVLHPHLAYEEEFISMFLDEARLAARIRHPNVVATLDISDTEGDGYFLVMDYIEGDHLGALLGRSAKRGERVEAPIVARVVLDALGGLGAAHQLTDETGAPLNLVHRDVSPHNVMVGTDGIGRLTDFGVAKAEVRMASTRAGQFKGKLSYMAPEQASTGVADQRSDLFSMGVILWESLTGRRLFRGENNAATLNKILRDPIPLPSELWPDLECFDEVLGKALAREPEERFQSAEEFAEALEKASQGGPGIATARQVGSLTADLVGEKLEVEKGRVREAIDTLGKSEIGEARMPLPREGSISGSMSQSGARPVTGEFATHTGTHPALVMQAPANDNRALIVTLIVAILVVGGIFVWKAQQPAAPTTPVVVQQPAPAAPAAPAPAAAAAPAPAAAVPAAAPAAEAPAEAAEPVEQAEEPARRVTRRPTRRGTRRPAAAAPMATAAPMVTMEPAPAPMAPAPAPMAPMSTMHDISIQNPYR